MDEATTSNENTEAGQIDVNSDEIGAVSQSLHGSQNSDRIVEKSEKFNDLVLENLIGNTKSPVWNHFKRLFKKQSDKIIPVKQMVGRVVCVPCFKKPFIKRYFFALVLFLFGADFKSKIV